MALCLEMSHLRCTHSLDVIGLLTKMPVLSTYGEVRHYNLFRPSMLVRVGAIILRPARQVTKPYLRVQ
jgi:hypothetical protein